MVSFTHYTIIIIIINIINIIIMRRDRRETGIFIPSGTLGFQAK